MNQVEKKALNVKISQQAKSALKSAADQEQKNMTDMLEKIITIYCERNQIPVSKPESGNASGKLIFWVSNNR